MEIQASKIREKWVRSELKRLTLSAGLSMPSFGIANLGAHYSPLWHRIEVSRALLARLSDTDLSLILAHELGHASRRWQIFCRNVTVDEEILADRFALGLTRLTPEQWSLAIRAGINAEPAAALMAAQLVRRSEVLGVLL